MLIQRTMSHCRKHQYEKSLGRNRTEFKLPTNFLQISVQQQHFIKSTSSEIFFERCCLFGDVFVLSLFFVCLFCWGFFGLFLFFFFLLFKEKIKGKDTQKKMSNSNPVL